MKPNKKEIYCALVRGSGIDSSRTAFAFKRIRLRIFKLNIRNFS